MRVAIIATSVCLSIVGLANASDVQARMRETTHIAPQPLDSALRALATARGFHIVYLPMIVRSVRTRGASGVLTQDEALTQLLNGTGLAYHYLDDETVTIVPLSSGPSGGQPASEDSAKEAQEGKKNSSDTFHLAQTAAGSPQSAPSLASSSGAREAPSPVELQEVVVTAQKRAERLQDVPVPVTAINVDALLGSNQLRLEDYYVSAPGLSVAPDQLEGTARLTIRGLTTGGLSNPTVGIVVDDVPYGSSTGIGSGYVVPNIDPSDLARVEVLRGPQGTLYGASSMGGLLKYVTVDPSTESFGGRVQGDVGGVQHGEGVGYGIRGALNVPLGDSLAVRLSGFDRRDAGYIDNPILHLNGVNRLDVFGGRMAALWKPSGDFSLKLSALFQDSKTAGTSFVQAGLGDLQQVSAADAGGYHVKLEAYSATLQARLGRFDLVCVTGYNINRNSFTFDLTPFFGRGQDVVGNPSPSFVKTTKVTQEVRLTTQLGERIDWLIGGFYTHERTPQTQSILTTDFLTGAVTGSPLLSVTFPSTFTEYAGFSDLTFRLSDRFDLQVGARESHNRQSYSQTQSGALLGVLTQPDISSSDNSFTYLVTPRFKLSSDLMVYARLASGYRPGGPNTNIALGLPLKYGPDKTLSYELGVKGTAAQQRLSFDASLYYIDWKNIQLKLVDPNTDLGYTANGSRAKSEGVEISVQARPWTGAIVSTWVAYNNAVLTENFPPLAAHGVDGDRLPNSSRFSGNLSAEQDFPIRGSVTGLLGATLSYFSDSVGLFTATSQRQLYPAYARTDVRAGVRGDLWQLNFYINNAADKRALLSGGIGSTFPTYFQYIQPRTAGLSISREF